MRLSCVPRTDLGGFPHRSLGYGPKERLYVAKDELRILDLRTMELPPTDGMRKMFERKWLAGSTHYSHNSRHENASNIAGPKTSI
jgi:hypothetical protein